MAEVSAVFTPILAGAGTLASSSLPPPSPPTTSSNGQSAVPVSFPFLSRERGASVVGARKLSVRPTPTKALPPPPTPPPPPPPPPPPRRSTSDRLTRKIPFGRTTASCCATHRCRAAQSSVRPSPFAPAESTAFIGRSVRLSRAYLGE
jgi:hypothetical protein